MPSARFDDLTPGAEHAFVFEAPGPVVAAYRSDEVADAIGAVQRLSRDGWWLAGYVAYEAAPGLDPGLVVHAPAAGDALVWFAAFERRAEVDPVRPRLPADEADYRLEPWFHEMSAAEHGRAVRRIREHIADGDTYQVNLTYRMRSRIDGDRFAFYRDLVAAQRGGYGAYLETGSLTVASASPERFFRVRDRRIDVKPMKGTARRGRWAEEDVEMRQMLRESDKDRAENIMIVDLLRNDVGRVAEFGSVAVERLLDVERYETVWQLTSEISARLRPDEGLAPQFVALFPSGSVTGAPKRRTMEIVKAVEKSPRGVYCGAVGFVEPGDGDVRASFNVAIRTAVVREPHGEIEYGIGGGITWDSDAAREHAEALLKADVLRVPPRPSGLFETLHWTGRGFRLWDRHLLRLERSAGYFGFPFDAASARRAAREAAAGRAAGTVIRVVVDRDGRVHADARSETVEWRDPDDGGDPVRLAVSSDAVVSSDVRLFHKTVERDRYDRRRAAHDGVDDVLLVNERDEITETTIANVAVDLGDGWVTPPLESGCLPGTYRAELIDSGHLTERVVTRRELGSALRLAVFNSVRGWRPATLAGER